MPLTDVIEDEIHDYTKDKTLLSRRKGRSKIRGIWWKQSNVEGPITTLFIHELFSDC